MKTLKEFIFARRSKGGYSFSLDEVKRSLGLSYNAAKQTLYQHQKKKQIALIRNGFYVIIPPEYSHSGMLPIYLFIDDLMKWLDKPYYLSLFTAAALHGAAHQQPMESFVITVKPALRNVKNEKLIINFSVKNSWDKNDIIQKKTDAGYVNVSSVELTALDLMYYMKHSGISRCATVISELAESMSAEKLKQTALRYAPVAAIQRLGYLLDTQTGRKDLAEQLQKILDKKKYFYAPLSTHHSKKGTFIPKWKIIKNTGVESDI
ncbi:type IV toxin-antitoxin system AbiEi family antitoxin [bacterium]|nr:type IV toxin-antitoxin system AbiEi family antitoxin [bacterium]MBU3930619.1 type IV toxin-antitoxin system AbiEi family antitoxin [bacterium]